MLNESERYRDAADGLHCIETIWYKVSFSGGSLVCDLIAWRTVGFLKQ
jgi:hypothetical protein